MFDAKPANNTSAPFIFKNSLMSKTHRRSCYFQKYFDPVKHFLAATFLNISR